MKKILLFFLLWSISFALTNAKDIDLSIYDYLIPAYWYSYDLNNQLLSIEDKSSIVIVNPSNGDFNDLEDIFLDEINKIYQKNNLAIWYVYTKYSKRDIEEVKNRIDNWLKYYPNINWFFLDETSNTADKINYYTNIYNYIKSKDPNLVVVLNPWNIPDKWYLKISDNIVVYENPCNTYSNYKLEDWLIDKGKKISFLWYGCDKYQYNNLANKYWKYITYFTDDWNDLNPWDNLSNYLLNKNVNTKNKDKNVFSKDIKEKSNKNLENKKKLKFEKLDLDFLKYKKYFDNIINIIIWF